jgi:acyl-CoA reductase-like NAD-dependent aldehyde dehydrogenase
MATHIKNWINGAYADPVNAGAEWLDVDNPATGEIIAKVCVSSAADVDAAVKAAKEAFTKWSDMTVKMRAGIMFKVRVSISLSDIAKPKINFSRLCIMNLGLPSSQ